MPKFSVTFERFFPHGDEEDVCEPDETGFVSQGASFRDALEDVGGIYANSFEPSDSRVGNARWFTNYAYNEGTHESYVTGIKESRSFHIPESVTTASRLRIARLLGIRTGSP